MPKETFAARYENLAQICEFVTIASEAAGLGEADAYCVELATNEACTNIREDSYGGDKEGTLECVSAADDKGVTLVFRYWGKPVDANEVPEKTVDKPLEKVDLRGIGLRLIRGAMDEVEFEALPVGGNRLTMRKYR